MCLSFNYRDRAPRRQITMRGSKLPTVFIIATILCKVTHSLPSTLYTYDFVSPDVEDHNSQDQASHSTNDQHLDHSNTQSVPLSGVYQYREAGTGCQCAMFLVTSSEWSPEHQVFSTGEQYNVDCSKPQSAAQDCREICEEEVSK